MNRRDANPGEPPGDNAPPRDDRPSQRDLRGSGDDDRFVDPGAYPGDEPVEDDFEAGALDDEEFGDEHIEASLNDALNDLERMLQQHEGSEEEAEASSEDEPYPIPLLEEMVIPGPGIDELHAGLVPASDEPAALMDEDSVRRRLAERLASEVEVIVQDRFEAAIEKARDEVREQVRNHMDIILPEILEEMLQHRHRDRD
jgi:hypothetical protein